MSEGDVQCKSASDPVSRAAQSWQLRGMQGSNAQNRQSGIWDDMSKRSAAINEKEWKSWGTSGRERLKWPKSDWRTRIYERGSRVPSGNLMGNSSARFGAWGFWITFVP